MCGLSIAQTAAERKTNYAHKRTEGEPGRNQKAEEGREKTFIINKSKPASLGKRGQGEERTDAPP